MRGLGVSRVTILVGLAVLGMIGGAGTLASTTHRSPTATTTSRPTPAVPTARGGRSLRASGLGGGPTTGRCPSPVPGQTQTLGHRTYVLEGLDTFTKNAPLGSLAPAKANQIVYTGDHGMRWTGYPDGWPSTYSGRAEGYHPSTVLSIHNGVLDFHLHNDAHGNPVGADPSPLPGGKRYQTYGAWSLCEKVAPSDSHNLAGFHQAFLLWPRNEHNWLWAESDYPEEDLDTFDFAGYSHYGGGGEQEIFDIQAITPGFDARQWHVYTQVWGPGFRSYYVDGRLVGTSTTQVWSGPERWQLQIEPLGPNDRDSGHVYVKWVWVGSLAPKAP
jgi:hypothetical protein